MAASAAALPTREAFVLSGHEGAALNVVFNPMGTYCLSCGKVGRGVGSDGRQCEGGGGRRGVLMAARDGERDKGESTSQTNKPTRPKHTTRPTRTPRNNK